MKDERFSHIVKDHRFRRVPLQERRVKIDKRFKGMFSDKKFKMKYTIDKRGRPTNLSTNEDLHKFYELDSEEEDSDDNDKEKRLKKKRQKEKKGKDVKVDKKKKSKDKKVVEENDSSSDDDDDDDEEEEKEEEESKSSSSEEDSETDVKGKDLARGEGNLESSSDEDEDDNDDDDEVGLSKPIDGGVDHKWNELDKEAPEAEELGRRLAICNLDWDRIKAVDIFVLLSSFLPTGGVLKSVKIYPSEFGKARMAEEAIKGPTELVKSTKIEGYSSDEEVTEDSEGTIYHREKLRQYQLTRLKYYYAVSEFDSIETANTVYGACDGTEYESSATRMDLRFVPDDMTFNEDEIKSSCNAMPSSSSYKPSLFFTSALCQSKVDLTWDETDHDRLKVTMRAPSKMDTATEDDFKAYLASSSDEEEDNPYGNLVGGSDEESQSEESENEEKHIDKYRKLLQSIQETEKEQENKDVEMEVTWEPGLKQTTEKLLKKKEEEKDSTTWEKYLMKKKEKKQKKREEKKMKSKEDKQESQTKGKLNKIDKEADIDDGEAAFSDDDLPGGVDMSEFTDELGGDTKAKKGKKKKKKKVVEKLTEEEKKEKATQEAELSLLMMDEKEDDRRHFNLKDLVEENTTKKKKKKKFKKKDLLKDKVKSEDDFKVNVEDERFTAMYSSHMYNLDPTAPEYKRTKGMEAIVNEKLKRSKHHRDQSGSSRKRDNQGDVTEPPSKVKRDSNHGQEASLQSLIKSVKTKTQNYNIKSKSKSKR